MIKIREDFEKFYDDFIHFSKGLYTIKNKVKSYQHKGGRKVKKLINWNAKNPINM